MVPEQSETFTKAKAKQQFHINNKALRENISVAAYLKFIYVSKLKRSLPHNCHRISIKISEVGCYHKV